MKRLLIAILIVTALNVHARNQQGPALPPPPPTPGVTTVTTAAQLVAAFPGSQADLVAGAIQAANVTGGNANSVAGKAAQQFVQTGTAVINSSSSAQSKALGRLGSRK